MAYGTARCRASDGMIFDMSGRAADRCAFEAALCLSL